MSKMEVSNNTTLQKGMIFKPPNDPDQEQKKRCVKIKKFTDQLYLLLKFYVEDRYFLVQLDSN